MQSNAHALKYCYNTATIPRLAIARSGYLHNSNLNPCMHISSQHMVIKTPGPPVPLLFTPYLTCMGHIRPLYLSLFLSPSLLQLPSSVTLKFTDCRGLNFTSNACSLQIYSTASNCTYMIQLDQGFLSTCILQLYKPRNVVSSQLSDHYEHYSHMTLLVVTRYSESTDMPSFH